MTKGLEKVSIILQANIADWKMERSLKIQSTLMHWKEIVGTLIAANSKPLRTQKNILHVAVRSSSWSNELDFHKQDILQRLNSMIGEEVYKNIRFWVYPDEFIIKETEAQSKPTAEFIGEPTADETYKSQHIFLETEPPELKSLLEKAMLAYTVAEREKLNAGNHVCDVCLVIYPKSCPECPICLAASNYV